MARITVEDCIDKFPSRFELVLVASNRARKLHSGEESTIPKDNDKNSVIALREIAEGTISVEDFKSSLIEEYQTFTINDEEEDLIIEDDLADEKDNGSLEISENETLNTNEDNTKNITENTDIEIVDKENTEEVEHEETVSGDTTSSDDNTLSSEIKNLE